MILHIKNNFIYLGIPHTGSTSIHEAVKEHLSQDIIFDNWKMKHATLSEIENYLKSHSVDLNGFWDVMYIKRSSLDVFLSKYYLLERVSKENLDNNQKTNHKNIKKWHRLIRDFRKKDLSIDQFLISNIEQMKNYDINIENYYLGQNKLKYNKIVYDYNNYEQAFLYLCERIGVGPIKQSRVNVTPSYQKQSLETSTIETLKQEGIYNE